ncbi:hypothetical protein [Mucilaginibacter gossypiicola]|nr:hypothetical protein [Mucilaginibacter gossypiicola]
MNSVECLFQAGYEPARLKKHRLGKPACLPISPLDHVFTIKMYANYAFVFLITRCAFAGLRQILGYAENAEKIYKEEIELVIADANKGFENELETISYIFNQVKLPISYLKIDY